MDPVTGIGCENLSDEQKLQIVRRLGAEAFEQIERGEYYDVDADHLDDFIEELAARARKRRPR